MEFLSFIDHFTLVHECGGIFLRICQQEHPRMSAFFCVYLLLHYFGQSEKYKVPTLVSITRKISGCSSFTFGYITTWCKYSARVLEPQDGPAEPYNWELLSQSFQTYDLTYLSSASTSFNPAAV